MALRPSKLAVERIQALRRGRIVNNASWNALQQIITLGSNALLGIVLVVALSPQDFGTYSYATAMVAIGVAIMTAGLSGLAVKEYVHGEARAASTTTELLTIRGVFALVGYLFIGLLALLTSGHLAFATTLLASFALFGRAMDVPEYWYVARMDSRTPAQNRIVVTLGMLAVRVILLVSAQNLWLFLAVFALEALLIGGLIVVKYRRDPASPGFAGPDFDHLRSMISQSLPLMLSGIANQINLRGDIVIISGLLGATSVGVYSAAARFSELAYFLPVVFMNAAFPQILRQRKNYGENHPEYLALMQRAYDIAFWSGLIIAVVTGIAGSWVINTWFDDVYQQSRTVLLIHVCACPFVFMAAVYSKWIIAENILWASLLRHSLGAVVNIALCLWLVPSFGVPGAAIATLASYVSASYLSCFFGGVKNRRAGMAMTLAMIAPLRLMQKLRQSAP